MKWRQTITLALSLTRSNSFILPSATIPLFTCFVHHLFTGQSSYSLPKSIFLMLDTGRAQAVYFEIIRVYGDIGAQYSFVLGNWGPILDRSWTEVQ